VKINLIFDAMVMASIKIVMLCFEEFKKKHFIKIQKKLNLSEEQLRRAVNMIIRLNPKPGGYTSSFEKSQYLTPDFILKETNGKLSVSLNSKNAPELKISRSYADMLDSYSKAKKKDKSIKQTVTFVKQKLDAAKWFIDAIKQRQETLLKTMRAIVSYQYDFFMSGDESKLRPMGHFLVLGLFLKSLPVAHRKTGNSPSYFQLVPIGYANH